MRATRQARRPCSYHRTADRRSVYPYSKRLYNRETGEITTTDGYRILPEGWEKSYYWSFEILNDYVRYFESAQSIEARQRRGPAVCQGEAERLAAGILQRFRFHADAAVVFERPQACHRERRGNGKEGTADRAGADCLSAGLRGAHARRRSLQSLAALRLSEGEDLRVPVCGCFGKRLLL